MSFLITWVCGRRASFPPADATRGRAAPPLEAWCCIFTPLAPTMSKLEPAVRQAVAPASPVLLGCCGSTCMTSLGCLSTPVVGQAPPDQQSELPSLQPLATLPPSARPVSGWTSQPRRKTSIRGAGNLLCCTSPLEASFAGCAIRHTPPTLVPMGKRCSQFLPLVWCGRNLQCRPATVQK